MSVSKAWDWSKETNSLWMEPSEESYYLAERWKNKYQKLLDFGSGLGRHSIFFAKCGFKVSAFDLSREGVEHLRNWAEREKLNIKTEIADMQNLPYPEKSFDCIFAYHVISHTDTNGMNRIISEIKRILKDGGEFYLTLCSKETWSFKEAGFPKLDANTVIKKEDGPENDIPHFFVSLNDIIRLFKEFEIIRIRHTDDCYSDGKKRNSKHYFILGSQPSGTNSPVTAMSK